MNHRGGAFILGKVVKKKKEVAVDVTGCGNRSKRAGRDNRKRRIGLLGNYDGIPGGYLECQATPVTQT